MADCLKNLKKRTVRVKESVLESLGKADRTKDNDFFEINSDFMKQQKNGYQLRKDLRSYLVSMRVANQALRNLHDTINSLYEPELLSSEKLKYLTQDNEASWDVYLNRSDKAFGEVVQYCSSFPQLREKIAKRNRKLIDYDSARHSYDTVISSSRKTDDSVKKATDQLNVCKNLYESLNFELLNELPPKHDSRLPFILKVCHQFFDDTSKFHSHSYKITKDIAEIVTADELNFRNNPPKKKPLPIFKPTKVEQKTNYSSSIDRGNGTLGRKIQNINSSFLSGELKPYDSGLFEDSNLSLVSGQSGKVQVIHKYIPSDDGELTLDMGQIILILPFDGYLDQGWAYGRIEGSELRGLFPVTFTKCCT